MIHLYKNIFLTCTAVSIILSMIIDILHLQYDDGGLGGVLFLVSLITGFIRLLTIELLSLFSINIERNVVELILSLFIAIVLDFIARTLIGRLIKIRIKK